MKTHTATLNHTKSTPGTHVFTEVTAEGQPPVLGSVYVQRYLLKEPGELKMTVGETGAKDLPKGKDVLAVHFEIEKETSNTIRFKEVEQEGVPPRIKSLYLPKWYVGTTTKVSLVIHG